MIAQSSDGIAHALGNKHVIESRIRDMQTELNKTDKTNTNSG